MTVFSNPIQFFFIHFNRYMRRDFSLKNFSAVYLILFSFFYLSFCGCDKAESRVVPEGFNRRSFDFITQFALQNYIDPDSVNINASFVGAAEAAVGSLPYPLMLYPRSYYENRANLIKSDRIIPGKEVVLSKDDAFVVFVPDYVELDKKADLREKQEKLRRKNMSTAEKTNEALKLRDELQQEKKILETAWNKAGFSRNDFDRIVDWIEKNQSKYSKLPSTYKGPDPFENSPFEMNHVYFSAVNGFLQAMDPHSSVMDMNVWDKILQESEDSSFEGIGAMLRGGGNNDVIVETPLANSPALNAGLRAGDIIRKVDSKPIDGMPLSEVVRLIRGKKGTIVELEVERITQGGDKLPIRIERSVIKQLNVTSYTFPNTKYGVIKISSFLFKGKGPSEKVKEEYDRLIEKNGKLDGLVIDLRDNPGGYLNEAIDIGGLFLEKGKVVVQTKGKGTRLQPKHSNNGRIATKGIPIVVLINSNSASASEIVASALQDHEAALILGERSFGKASVQEMRPLGDVIIKVTTQRYYAPNGYTIQVAGVVPDIEISDELENNFPPRFREEDMWKHLPELETRNVSPRRKAWVQNIRSVVGDNAKAEEFIAKHKTDAKKPDYMLIRAVNYFEALHKFPHP